MLTLEGYCVPIHFLYFSLAACVVLLYVYNFDLFLWDPIMLKVKVMFCFLFCSGTLEIICSKDIKIQGIFGPCTSLEQVE